MTDTGDIDKQVQRFDDMPGRIQARLTSEMTAAMTDVSSIVKEQKLSGQVLHTRTGRLRRSIHPDVAVDGSTIAGTVGTNVEYARIQEYGGVIERQARTQVIYRKTVRGDLQNRFVRKSQSNFASQHAVGAYKITIPERSYLRSTLREQAVPVRDRLAAAAVQEAKA